MLDNRPLRLVAVTAALLGLFGCAGGLQKTLEDALPNRDVDYKSARRLPPLEVPPGLSAEGIRDGLAVPSSGEVSLRELQAGGGARATPVGGGVLPQIDNVRVERNGDQRWLVVQASPEQVWPRLRDFWLDNGFIIAVEDPSIGIMETDWAENRADIPKGLIESVLSRVSDSFYSAATRDKFRVRLERGAQSGTTEVYISHRGAREVRSSGGDDSLSGFASSKAGYRWEPQAADPELEAEMLTRMLVAFGLEREQASQRVASTRDKAPRAHMVRDDSGASVLALREDFSRAWRRTGLALDRVGFTVEDRDRSRGLYFVRYVDPSRDAGNSEGMLSRLKFWGDDEPAPGANEYLISLIGGDNTTQVVVLDKSGERERSDTAARILGLLHDELK